MIGLSRSCARTFGSASHARWFVACFPIAVAPAVGLGATIRHQPVAAFDQRYLDNAKQATLSPEGEPRDITNGKSRSPSP